MTAVQMKDRLRAEPYATLATLGYFCAMLMPACCCCSETLGRIGAARCGDEDAAVPMPVPAASCQSQSHGRERIEMTEQISVNLVMGKGGGD